MKDNRFYSSGKLLLSGEYLVLQGATALALPVNFGQTLEVYEISGAETLKWETKVLNKSWFTAEFSLPDLGLISSSDTGIASFLVKILKASEEILPSSPIFKNSLKIKTSIDFDISWGLGSSSSLISNIAYWLKIDPFELYWRVSEGSGYDIACARIHRPILYRLINGKPSVEEIVFSPSFRNNLYFINLGRKKDSQTAVREFKRKHAASAEIIKDISEITMMMAHAETLAEFENSVVAHEELLSGLLGIPSVQMTDFNDFHGKIKSLGAWGGDFILATWRGTEQELQKYFNNKGLRTIFTYDQMIPEMIS